MNTHSRSGRVSGRRETVGRHGTTRVDQARESRGFTSSTMYISRVLTKGVALDGCPLWPPFSPAPPSAGALAMAYSPLRASAPSCPRNKDIWPNGNA
jgi:hypothetical protein